jgi:hypothetical protein
VRFKSKAAAQLDWYFSDLSNLANRIDIHRFTGNGSVEIDNMEPFGACLDPSFGGGGWSFIEGGFLIEIALNKADAAPASNIDSRIDDHCTLPTRLG